MAILIDPAVTVTVTNSRTSKVERGRQGEHRAGVSPRASEPGRGRGAFSREVMGREGAKLCETGGEVDVTSVLGAIEIERTRSRPPPALPKDQLWATMDASHAEQLLAGLSPNSA